VFVDRNTEDGKFVRDFYFNFSTRITKSDGFFSSERVVAERVKLWIALALVHSA
jgi:hypothetical protein